MRRLNLKRGITLVLVLILMISSAGVAAVAEELFLNGYAVWYNFRGNSTEYLNYMFSLDEDYTRIKNEAGVITCGMTKVAIGGYMDTWLDLMDGNSKYFSLFCDLLESACGISDFSNTTVELVDSELYGWGVDPYEICIFDEYYMFKLTYANGSWDKICVRMFCEIDGGEMIYGRVYDSYSASEAKKEFEDKTLERPNLGDNKGTVEQNWQTSTFWSKYPNYEPFMGRDFGTGHGSDDWCMGDFLFTADATYFQVINCESYVSLRKEASADTERILKVPLGASVLVNGELNGWMLCQYEGRYGWIKSKYLTEEDWRY